MRQRVGAQRVHFVNRDQAFRLGADVNDNAITGDADNGAFKDFTAAKRMYLGRLFLREQGSHVHHVVHVFAHSHATPLSP